MTLLNVIYVSNFMINIVAKSILKNKRFHFDIQYCHFYENDSAVILMFRVKTYYIFKNNKKIKEIFAMFIRADFTYDWHQFLVHINNEIIQYLTIATQGIKFTDKESVFKINKYVEYIFFKTHKIVSRFITKSEMSKKLFSCMTYGFIVLNTTMNKIR